jgi:hypothetical protein
MRPHECLKELTCPDLPTQEVDSTKSRGTLRELKYDSSFTITFPLFDKDSPTDVRHGYGTAPTKEKCRKKECTTEPIQTLFWFVPISKRRCPFNNLSFPIMQFSDPRLISHLFIFAECAAC